MLARVTAKNVKGSFFRHSIYSGIILHSLTLFTDMKLDTAYTEI